MREMIMRSSIVFVLSLFLSIVASGAYADDACRCKGCGCKGGPGWLGRVEVCPRHDLRLAGRGAVQAGVVNTGLLRQQSQQSALAVP